MSKRLIIVAHPSQAGFTYRIVDALVQGGNLWDHESRILDLYTQENQQTYLEMDEKKEIKINEKTAFMQQMITWADDLIFVFPVWWGGMPAVMKNWIDINFLSGFAYKYNENGKLEKLLSGKKARVYCTCDAPAIIYKFPVNIFTTNITGWAKFIFGFCGIKLVCFEMFWSMRKQDEQARNTILEYIKKWAC